MQLRRGDGEVGVFLLRRVEELIIDIQLHDAARGEVGTALGALAVYFDALETDVFLQQRIRQQGHGLGHKAVEPLPGVIRADGQFLHSRPPKRMVATFYHGAGEV